VRGGGGWNRDRRAERRVQRRVKREEQGEGFLAHTARGRGREKDRRWRVQERDRAKRTAN